MQRLRYAGSNPVFIEGQTEAGDWQMVQAGVFYLMLQFGAINFLRDDLNNKSGGLIQLLLDAPLVDSKIQPFQTMYAYAQALSERIGARIVDDQKRPVSERALHAIEMQLGVLYETLEAAGMPAGSPAVRRLLSQ